VTGVGVGSTGTAVGRTSTGGSGDWLTGRIGRGATSAMRCWALREASSAGATDGVFLAISAMSAS
jgi:hypothetical protein